MVATRTAGQPSPKKLRFRDKLVGKGLSTDALLKKLKQLHQELADMDQEHVDVLAHNALQNLHEAQPAHHAPHCVKAS